MLFQTPEFAILMISVLMLVALVRTYTLQMMILLVASYYFYMSWNPWFVLLVFYTTLNDYLIGIALGATEKQKWRRFWIVVSCFTNLSILVAFKYFNFFIDSVNTFATWTGNDTLLPFLRITLPVGISFYTFHSMGYTIDVYRRHAPVERSLIRFAMYVVFFPQLVAGPILRCDQFLPQLRHMATLRSQGLRSGSNLFLVGLVKKVVVADNVSPLSEFVFNAPQGLPSIVIILGTIAFGIQIYCDFSGYTDMARGAGRMLGYEIPLNFNYPYFAKSITDFWRRWHISLSSWLRDYLYIPLGGNRYGEAKTYRNLLLTMGLGGLWHGAGWNFVAWGLYQGGLLSVERFAGISVGKKAEEPTFVRKKTRALRVLGVVGAWLICQYLVFLGWLLFRVTNSKDLIYCVKKYVLFDFEFRLGDLGLGNIDPFLICAVIIAFAIIHFFSHRIGSIAAALDRLPRHKTVVVYALAVFALVWFWPHERQAFIYFQF